MPRKSNKVTDPKGTIVPLRIIPPPNGRKSWIEPPYEPDCAKKLIESIIQRKIDRPIRK
jgi:hypothetical protein